VTKSVFDAAHGDDAIWLRRLLDNGADPNKRRNGTTPLYVASGNAQKARLLLEAGADPNAESPEGTPLCFAASWGELESVRILLDHGADSNLIEDADATGVTPLIWAVQKGHTEVARLLLERAADPNLAPSGGITPLMAAAMRGSIALTQLLLEHDADPAAMDEEGQTACDVAEAWAAKDLESELHRFAREGDEIATRRTPQPDGTDLLEVEIAKGQGKIVPQIQTGHAEIAALLRDLTTSGRHEA